MFQEGSDPTNHFTILRANMVRLKEVLASDQRGGESCALACSNRRRELSIASIMLMAQALGQMLCTQGGRSFHVLEN